MWHVKQIHFEAVIYYVYKHWNGKFGSENHIHMLLSPSSSVSVPGRKFNFKWGSQWPPVPKSKCQIACHNIEVAYIV